MENENIPGNEIASECDSASPVSPGLNEKVNQLVSLSKKHGYVTVQNINEVIPESASDPIVIENIMDILDNLDIKLLDEDEVESFRKKPDESEQAEGPVAWPDRPVVPHYDPFDVYLEQVRLKPRVSRARELELFQHITDGEHRAQEFLFSRWLTLPFHLDLARKLLNKEERTDAAIDGRKVKRGDNFLSTISRLTESGDKLCVRLDALWQTYLTELDPQLKAKALEAYNKAELDSSEGCKFLLRKFCFKMCIFEEWLDRPNTGSGRYSLGTDTKIEDNVRIWYQAGLETA